MYRTWHNFGFIFYLKANFKVEITKQSILMWGKYSHLAITAIVFIACGWRTGWMAWLYETLGPFLHFF